MMSESTRGTFQAPSSATNATFIAQNAMAQFDLDLRLAVDRVLGSPDPAGVYPTLIDPVRLSMVYPGLIGGSGGPGTTFMQYGLNLTNRGTSFSMVFRYTLGPTMYYMELARCVIGAGTISCMGAGPITASCWIAAKLAYVGTTPPSNWTFVTPPTTPIMMSLGEGALPVTLTDVTNGNATYQPSVRGWTVGFNNAPFPLPQVGQNTLADMLATTRSVIVRYVCNPKDATMLLMTYNQHVINSAIVLDSGNTFTGTGGLLGTFKGAYRADQPPIEGFEHVCQTANLS
jgi:hypothetical protein